MFEPVIAGDRLTISICRRYSGSRSYCRDPALKCWATVKRPLRGQMLCKTEFRFLQSTSIRTDQPWLNQTRNRRRCAVSLPTRRIASAQPPAEPAPPEVKPISKAAGGMASALTAARFALSEMGVVRGARTLLQVNQPDGIDCPGCAWPEPDSERSHFEFCEEGAKHVADEATTKRVTPEFFAKWSVEELAEQSDLWLNQQGRLTHPMILREGAQHYEAD